MMTQTGGVSVVAANVAQTDRRALSQAWYSALHVPEHDAPHAAPSTRRDAASAFSDAVAAHGADTGRRSTLPAASARQHAGRAGTIGHPPERRAPKTELARRIERAVEHHPRRRNSAVSVSVKTSGGRVQLLVRSDGAVTRVVALCAPPLKERVERALAQARFALAAGGARIGSCA